jgi:hypothetical protein
VVALSVRIGDKAGFTEMDRPYHLEPKGNLTLEQSVAAYGDFCNGVWKQAIVIRDVSFADGSKWEFKESVGG